MEARRTRSAVDCKSLTSLYMRVKDPVCSRLESSPDKTSKPQFPLSLNVHTRIKEEKKPTQFNP